MNGPILGQKGVLELGLLGGINLNLSVMWRRLRVFQNEKILMILEISGISNLFRNNRKKSKNKLR